MTVQQHKMRWRCDFYSYKIMSNLVRRIDPSKGFFLEIIIFIVITILLRRWILIHLKNENNRNRLHFSGKKKKNYLLFSIFFHFFFVKKKKKRNKTKTPLIVAGRPPIGVVGQSHMEPGVVAMSIWGWLGHLPKSWGWSISPTH
jgi:hypothetical protein